MYYLGMGRGHNGPFEQGQLLFVFRSSAFGFLFWLRLGWGSNCTQIASIFVSFFGGFDSTLDTLVLGCVDPTESIRWLSDRKKHGVFVVRLYCVLRCDDFGISGID